MIIHSLQGNNAIERSRIVGALIRKGEIRWGGHMKLKIYGRLGCGSGKRMLEINRVFFATIDEAVAAGYRPCGNCMRTEYLKWKALRP